jgi:hypothetical protein
MVSLSYSRMHLTKFSCFLIKRQSFSVVLFGKDRFPIRKLIIPEPDSPTRGVQTRHIQTFKILHGYDIVNCDKQFVRADQTSLTTRSEIETAGSKI